MTGDPDPKPEEDDGEDYGTGKRCPVCGAADEFDFDEVDAGTGSSLDNWARVRCLACGEVVRD